jgi:hypothetical protein
MIGRLDSSGLAVLDYDIGFSSHKTWGFTGGGILKKLSILKSVNWVAAGVRRANNKYEI